MKPQKPASIAYKDFRSEILSAINNSGLPPFIIESVLREYLREVSAQANTQYKEDELKYNEALNAKPANASKSKSQE